MFSVFRITLVHTLKSNIYQDALLCVVRPKRTGAHKWSKYTDRKAKLQYSCICSSVMSYPNGPKFTVELASMQGRPHSNFE